jgi:hypothetical protein
MIEFKISPIDIYRQKTDDDFIGALHIFAIDVEKNNVLQSMNISHVSSLLLCDV